MKVLELRMLASGAFTVHGRDWEGGVNYAVAAGHVDRRSCSVVKIVLRPGAPPLDERELGAAALKLASLLPEEGEPR